MRTKGFKLLIDAEINGLHRIKDMFVAVAEGNDERGAYRILMRFLRLQSKRGCLLKRSWRELSES